MPRRRMKWELYEEFLTRTTQAQPLTAQELDLRNFFQRYKVKFWVHPIWKATEDQCFYVYDFAFRFTSSGEPSTPTSLPLLEPFYLPDPDLWLLECSYTTLKSGQAKKSLRKRCPVFDRKFRTAKRLGVNTVLLLEALHVPPQVLRQSMPTLEYVDLLFTAVEALKGWVLEHIEGNEKRSKERQGQLNGFLKARENLDTAHRRLDRSHPDPSRPDSASEECNNEGVT